MPSRILPRWALGTKSASSYLRLTSRGPMGTCLTSNANTSRRFPVQRFNATVLQTRSDIKGHVHKTRSRRLFGSLKIAGIVVACCFGAAGTSCLFQVATGGTIPPHVWARQVDQQTREEVEAALVEEFDMARNTLPHQLNDALREATFRVPHELARLNNDAPGFILEEIGPMVDVKEGWKRSGEKFPSLAPFLDLGAETRVFLYFPNGATKATVIFVAVNAELPFPIKKWDWSVTVDSFLRRCYRAVIEVSLIKACWICQHKIWARNHQAVISRVEEMERIPVIFNFREKAFGVMYYRRLGLIVDIMSAMPLSVRHLDRGISLH